MRCCVDDAQTAGLPLCQRLPLHSHDAARDEEFFTGRWQRVFEMAQAARQGTRSGPVPMFGSAAEPIRTVAAGYPVISEVSRTIASEGAQPGLLAGFDCAPGMVF